MYHMRIFFFFDLVFTGTGPDFEGTQDDTYVPLFPSFRNADNCSMFLYVSDSRIDSISDNL